MKEFVAGCAVAAVALCRSHPGACPAITAFEVEAGEMMAAVQVAMAGTFGADAHEADSDVNDGQCGDDGVSVWSE